MTPRPTFSAIARRDFALMGFVCVVVVSTVLAAGVLAFGAALATVVCGGPWQAPAASRWLGFAGRILAHPGHLELAMPPPWGPVLAGHSGVYWMVTVGLGVMVGAALAVIGRTAWQVVGPMPAGHASRFDVHRELSTSAARRTARWTRPRMTPQQRHRAKIDELAVPGHFGPHGRTLWTPLENPTGCIAPTQSGKSRGELVHKALAAPGALLCSTTKADLLEFAALARSRRDGPVVLFDATGTVRWPAALQWSPIEGCQDPDVARRRAVAMVDAASLDVADVGGNDRVFRSRAKTVLQAYLLAAAHAGRSVETLVNWAVTRESEPVDLLMATHPDLARNLRKELGMVAETSDAVWMSVRRTLEPLMEPNLRHLCNPPAGHSFDVRSFIRARGSLFFIAGEHQAAQAAPILTALAEHWLTTAQQMALEASARRLDPPATAVLDEVTHATPVPRLPEFIADSAGRGVLIHWAAQSMAKLEGTFGVLGARQLVDNTTLLSFYSGLKDQRTLEWISVLAGHDERIRYQQFNDGALGVGRTSIGTETVPVYRAGDVRTMRRQRVLVIHRNLRPIEARLVDVTKRRDWKTHLRADVTTVRAGTAPIRPDGYPQTAQHDTAGTTQGGIP